MIFSGRKLSREAGVAGRKGFTLVEMAIVLGIVMLVFAGVFGAAQVARNRADINVASNHMLQIVTNMRDLFMSRNVAAVSGAPSMGELIQSGVFPVDMLDPQPDAGQLPSATAHVHHVWAPTGDHSVLIPSLQKISDPANPSTQITAFTLRYLHVPADVCIEFVNNNSTPGPETGLTEIKVNGTDFAVSNSTYPLPPPKKDLVSACMNGSTGKGEAMIEWSFELSL